MDPKELRGLYEAYKQVNAPEEIEELYKGKHGQSEKEYADSRSPGGKMVSGDSKQSGAEYTHGRRVKAANPGMQPDVGGKTRPKSQGKMDRGTRADLEYRKANLKKEELELDQIIESLIERGHTEQEAYALVAQFTLDEGVIDFVKSGVERHKSAMKGAKEAKKRHDAGVKKLGKTVKPVVDDAKKAVKKGAEIAGAVGRGIKAAAELERKGAAAVHAAGRKMKAAKKAVMSTEDLEFIAQYVIDEGYDLSDYTWEEFAEICEAEKPFPYEKVKAKQVALRDKGGNALDRRMKMGMAVRRAKEAEKTGGSQRDAGKGWYHAKEEFVGEASRADDTTRANIARYAGKKGISFEPGPNWDPSANRGRGAHLNPKQKEKQRRKALRQEDFEFWVNALVEEGYDLSDYTWDEMYEFYLDEAEKPFPYEKVTAQQKKHTAAGRYGNMMKMGLAKRRAKEAEKTGGSQRDAGKGWYHAKEDYVNEAQHARENPEKYEREQEKKTAPVRGEKTPMPPRGDKRREDFEKWYAKQMGR